jgi:acyl-CoA reductase-like NAD-dependent aldehyde dehydrogenase
MAVKTATQIRPMFLAGQWETSPDVLRVENPAFPGELVGETFNATTDQYEEAARAAVEAFEVTKRLAGYERGHMLRAISQGIAARRTEIATSISREAGKTIRDALVEVDRASLVFRLAGEEAERIVGEVIPLDVLPSSKGRVGITRRFPLGPVAAISPFNFPLNLAAHKVAPALAAGCSVLLKLPSVDPLAMLIVAEVIEAAGVPKGAVSILPMRREVADRLVADDRFKVLNFTGSSAVGWGMKARAGKKKLILELGGNGGVIVDRSADLDWAVRRVTFGSFANAGQVCISVQRVFVHDDVWDPFVERFIASARALKMGDPLDETTDLGPMIDLKAATRAESWVREAEAAGASVLTGGSAKDAFFEPTILTNVPPTCHVCSDEIFAPVVVVERYRDFEDATRLVNSTPYGLQAGIFTNDLAHAWQAFNDLEVGGVIVNDVPTYRVDNMPYGGTKDSGMGREGIRYAIQEMTETKLLVLAQPS